MRNLSTQFLAAKKGSRGRKLVKYLDDRCVAIAKKRNESIEHRMKFMPPMKRYFTALALA